MSPRIGRRVRRPRRGALLITGHQPQEAGYAVNGDRHIIIASDHNQGVFLPLSLSETYEMDALPDGFAIRFAVAAGSARSRFPSMKPTLRTQLTTQSPNRPRRRATTHWIPRHGPSQPRGTDSSAIPPIPDPDPRDFLSEADPTSDPAADLHTQSSAVSTAVLPDEGAVSDEPHLRDLRDDRRCTYRNTVPRLAGKSCTGRRPGRCVS